MEGFSVGERRLLKKLGTPRKIQDFVETFSYNNETLPNGDPTCYSPRYVLERRSAHCLEGALFAAAALRVNGYPAQLMDFTSSLGDDDHDVALHWRQDKRGKWYRGCIGMSSYHGLMFRDAVYATPRELALSFIELYHLSDTDGRKTMRTYSSVLDLSRFDKDNWMTTSEQLLQIGEALNSLRHYPLYPQGFERSLRPVAPPLAKANKRNR